MSRSLFNSGMLSSKNKPPSGLPRQLSRGFSFSSSIKDLDSKGKKRFWITKFVLRQVNKAIKKDETLEELLEKKANKSYVYFTFFAGKFAFVCALFYFTYTGIIADQNRRFIALDESSGVCRHVPVAITGNFAMDSNGNYQGTQNFDAAKAYYYIELSNFQHDMEGYQRFIDQSMCIISVSMLTLSLCTIVFTKLVICQIFRGTVNFHPMYRTTP